MMATNIKPSTSVGGVPRQGKWVGRLFAGIAVSLLVMMLLVLTGRLAFSLGAAAITAVIIHLISFYKIRLVDEPLTFADFALLRHAIRHPKLYYANFLWSVPGIAAIVFTLGLIVAWLWIEPPFWLIESWSARLLLLLAAIGIFLVIFFPVRIPAVDALLTRVAPRPDLERDVERLGLIGSLTMYAMQWRRTSVFTPPSDLAKLGPNSPDVIIIVQIESFADPRSWGGEPVHLPNLEEAQRRALIAGPLAPLGHGAYTMRPEFEILTGIRVDDTAFDRFNPYLRGEKFAATALPNRFAAAGYQTVFIHPHDRTFFRRHKVMPSFGFQRLIDDRDFADSDFAGRYVGDVSIGRRIIAEVRAVTQPIFLFAVTMENHGPWAETADTTPWQQFASGLQSSDRMIGEIISELDALDRTAVLVFYGDHAPIMEGISTRVPTPCALITWPTKPKDTARSGELRPVDLHAAVIELLHRPPRGDSD